MRYAKSPLGALALALSAAGALACGKGEKAATKTDTAAAAAAAPPPAPAAPADSYTLTAKDGSWTVDITPASVVWHGKKGAKKDSLAFDYKAPTIDGAITKFEIIRTAPDTHTFAAQIAMTPCTDAKKAQYTYLAQVWVDQVAYSGCGTKK
jgi:uncharacterized membrane protein